MYVCKYIVYVNMLGQRNYTPVRITTCSQKPQPQTNIKSNPDINCPDSDSDITKGTAFSKFSQKTKSVGLFLGHQNTGVLQTNKQKS